MSLRSSVKRRIWMEKPASACVILINRYTAGMSVKLCTLNSGHIWMRAYERWVRTDGSRQLYSSTSSHPFSLFESFQYNFHIAKWLTLHSTRGLKKRATTANNNKHCICSRMYVQCSPVDSEPSKYSTLCIDLLSVYSRKIVRLPSLLTQNDGRWNVCRCHVFNAWHAVPRVSYFSSAALSQSPAQVSSSSVLCTLYRPFVVFLVLQSMTHSQLHIVLRNYTSIILIERLQFVVFSLALYSHTHTHLRGNLYTRDITIGGEFIYGPGIHIHTSWLW